MPNLKELKLLATHAPFQLYRYAIDWNKQMERGKLAVSEWEEREPGSLEAILNAYAETIPWIVAGPSKRIDVEELKTIHRLCTTDVVNPSFYFSPGKLREYGGERVFKLLKDINASPAGLKALVSEHKKYPYHLFPQPYSIQLSVDATDEENCVTLTHQLEAVGYINFMSYQSKDFDPKPKDEKPKLKYDDDSEDESDEDSDSDSEFNEREDFAMLYLTGERDNPRYISYVKRYQASLILEIKKTLDTLYIELEGASGDVILTAIVKAIRRLEHIHPFIDGNCRTFCMVLLNTLLMQHGFPPTLLCDPNKFDGYSIEELVGLVKEGMERTKDLCGSIIERTASPSFFPAASGGAGAGASAKSWMEVDGSQHVKLAEFAASLTTALLKAPGEASFPAAATTPKLA